MKVSNPKYTHEQVGLKNNPDDLPNFGQVSAEEGFTADFSDRDKNICMTHPNVMLKQMANYKYSIYNLDGICSCGKYYSDHPHFVKHNKEIEAGIREKINAELESAKANSEKINLEWELMNKAKPKKFEFDWFWFYMGFIWAIIINLLLS